MTDNATKKVAIIVSKGELDWAYPPFILGSTAAASNMEVWMFFTFYGLPLLKKKMSMRITPFGNSAMPSKMPFGPSWFQNFNWPLPNVVTTNVPFFQLITSWLLRLTFKRRGVAKVEELREACQDLGVKLIACQMTMDVFGFKKEEFLDGVEVGGAAMFLEYAAGADIQLFI